MAHNQIHQYAIKYLRLGKNPKIIEKMIKVGIIVDGSDSELAKVQDYIDKYILIKDETPSGEQGGDEQGNTGAGESDTPSGEPSTPTEPDNTEPSAPTDEPSTPTEPDVTDELNEEDEGISTGVVEE